jgi:serine/threonine protein phosphatase PrpC
MIDYHGQTDIGRHRKLNEDSIFADGSLFLVCDGMGGHKAGEVASLLAVETITSFVKHSEEDPELTWPFGFDARLPYNTNRLRTAIKLANHMVVKKAGSSDRYTGMGTTVVALIVPPARAVMTYAHVGDSRIYAIRDTGIEQLTQDDSVASLGWMGDETGEAPFKHILTKALGAREDLDFEVADRSLQPGEIILLCSDGLTNMLPDPEILRVVLASAHDLKQACRDLVAEANARGGRDNISAILLRHGG